MKKSHKIISLITLLIGFSLWFQAQNSNTVCANPTPFCTGQVMNFPAQTGGSVAQPGPNYGCLGSQPRPTWFYFQTATAGSMVITMSATNDIDFICWGPFPNLNQCGNLTSTTQVPGSGYGNPNSNGCSYSGSPTETCTIANCLPGQFYIMLITNFSGATQNITFTQQNSLSPGAASTNCGLVCFVNPTNSGMICAGSPATLALTTSSSVTSFTWSGPGGFSSSFTSAVVTGLLANATYTVRGSSTATLNGIPTTGTCQAVTTISVVPYPNFSVNPTYTSICQGGSFSAAVNFTTPITPGPFSFNWTPSPGSVIWSPFSQVTTIFPPLSPTNVTLTTLVYTVTVWPTNTFVTCPVSQTMQVIVNNPLTPSLTMPPPMCDIFSPISLVATPGGGTWSANPAVSPGGVFNPAIASNGTNIVTYAVSVGTCIVSNSDTVYVSTYVPPTLTNSISPMCVQDPSFNLMNIVQSTVTGSWYGPNVVSPSTSNYSFNPSGLATGNYTLTHRTVSWFDPAVCPDSTYLVVSVFNPVIPTIANITPKCTNAASVVLSATPPGGFWSGSTGVSPTGVQTPSSCAWSTINTVTYTAGQGTCVASSSRTFHVSRYNTAALTGTVPNMCVSTPPFNLMSIVQNTNGAWSGNVAANFFSPLGLPSNTYALVYSTVSTPDPFLCPETSTIIASVLNPPTPVITQAGPFCNAGAPVQLTVTPAIGYWVTAPYLNSNGLFSPALSPVGNNMVQYVIGTSTCNVSQTKYFSTEAFISAAITGVVPDVCNNGSPVNLAPITISNLGNWTGPGISGTSFNPVVTGPGKYTLQYNTSSIPSGLCPDQATVNVQVFSLAVPSIAKVGPLCNNAAPRQIQVSPVGGLFGSATPGLVTPSGVFNPALAIIGTNLISYSISVGPCLAYAQQSITIDKFIAATFEKMPEPFYCKNKLPFDLNSLVQNPGFDFSSNEGGVIGNHMFDPSSASTGPNVIEYFTHSASNALMCPDRSTIIINIKDVPKVSALSNKYEACTPALFVLSSDKTSGSGSWNFGDGTPDQSGLSLNHTYTTPGTYTVVFNYYDNDASACVAQALIPRKILVKESPVANFTYYPDELSISNPEITLNNRSTVLSDNKYVWTIQGLYEFTDINPQFNFPQIGNYRITLSATNLQGCTSETSQFVEVKNDFNIFIPNSFTPNADGLNDKFLPVFSPYGLDAKTYEMEIYDRWGHVIFNTKDYTKGWDGTLNNKTDLPLKEDSYTYRIRYKDLDGRVYNKTGIVVMLPN